MKLSIKSPKKGVRLDIGKISTSTLGYITHLIIENQVAENQVIPILVVTKDQQTTVQLAAELSFFLKDQGVSIEVFPDWETLPYDHFSPHKDILSQRLSVLGRLPTLKKGVFITSITTIMHRFPPRSYIESHCFYLKKGDRLDLQVFLSKLEKNGYQNVSQVMEHGEYSIRGSIIDLFPMGSKVPYRIDLLDEEVDSIRVFDIDTQKTVERVDQIALLPTREFPLNHRGVEHFRQAFRQRFDVNLLNCLLYQDVSKLQSPGGIEYYLPLFFEHTQTLFDYLPENSLIIRTADLLPSMGEFKQQAEERYSQLEFDSTRPLLSPKELFLNEHEVFTLMKAFSQIQYSREEEKINIENDSLPALSISHKPNASLKELADFIKEREKEYAILFCVETAGRREVLLNLLKKIEILPSVYKEWSSFLFRKRAFSKAEAFQDLATCANAEHTSQDINPSHKISDFSGYANAKAPPRQSLQGEGCIGIIVAPLVESFMLKDEKIIFLTESYLLGEKVPQHRMRSAKYRDVGTLVRNLNELEIGDPVVHIEHGVGRYRGLQTIETQDFVMECIVLEYANASKLYVPVSSLHLINRFSGVDFEHAPLDSLGSSRWKKAKAKALEKIKDVAAELLGIYAQRSSRKGFVYKKPEDYLAFVDGFPFEETPDQANAIAEVLQDMTSLRYMDRLVCGDVGFGKTEVAMRAAFIAVQNHKQVAVLVPTTVLAEQHFQNFKNRFADWPVKIASISRFSKAVDQKEVLAQLKKGLIDIVIGTHRLLQQSVIFHNLGLLIIDEEHRFGVSHKEKIKSKKSDVDILALSATPIPRTLNMSLNGIWDMSIIATPPAGRLIVKTFVHRYEDSLVKEAILRENLRGGQVYFVHNRVESIERVAEQLKTLIPGLRVGIAHGQMPEMQLERVMADFYHQKFNILLCTTIIESGIDVPTANTIIISRADAFGMAQLHQLRGRVGRSHHQAYAYLLMPPEGEITADAKRRLEALSQNESLGAGFNLASHDLEIRGAGELLGKEQSGHIQTIGFSLYTELLEEAVKALKVGKSIDFQNELDLINHTEIDLKMPALIPDSYIPDIHIRLVLYKRIASSKNNAQLDELYMEFIDRFGLLPEPLQNLLKITAIKLKAQQLGIEKLTMNSCEGKIYFNGQKEHPQLNVEALIKLIQVFPHQYQLKGDRVLNFSIKESSNEGKFKAINALLERIAK